MNYTFHQLQIFLSVVKHQSITRASEAMNMSQPALSIQLKNFQNQFDIPLIEYAGKRLQVTEFGHTVAQVANNILEEAEVLQYKTKQFRNLFAGKLRISSASTGKYVIPYFLSGFMDLHPSVDLVLDVSNKTTVIKHLLANDIDFALVSVLPHDLDLEEEVLMDNRLYMVSKKASIDPRLPLLFREDGSATRKAMDYYFSDNPVYKRLVLTSNEAVKQAVIAGIGYSILPLIGIKNELQNGTLSIVQAPGLPIITRWRLVWLKKKTLSPVAQAYLDFVREHKAEIIQSQFDWYEDYQDK
ncbi:MAG TPA: LysR family transcriptional regulator [Luteibaculaceae bacterium]|nr:LysR family transcriptional regulator [Luteibaculaceae bacterium]